MLNRVRVGSCVRVKHDPPVRDRQKVYYNTGIPFCHFCDSRTFDSRPHLYFGYLLLSYRSCLEAGSNSAVTHYRLLSSMWDAHFTTVNQIRALKTTFRMPHISQWLCRDREFVSRSHVVDVELETALQFCHWATCTDCPSMCDYACMCVGVCVSSLASVSGLVHQSPLRQLLEADGPPEVGRVSRVIRACCQWWWRAFPSSVLCRYVVLPLRRREYREGRKIKQTACSYGPDVDRKLSRIFPAGDFKNNSPTCADVCPAFQKVSLPTCCEAECFSITFVTGSGYSGILWAHWRLCTQQRFANVFIFSHLTNTVFSSMQPVWNIIC